VPEKFEKKERSRRQKKAHVKKRLMLASYPEEKKK